ncbi:Protein CBG19059 [Caenorhabditis briggsae]|uniref:Protein CBG19059 n=1 Tax=Caenorhabditis briggsae TaxID=6238 RepID=A8XUP2_CAEBR|nr:Protein CBG19059 [Caenorhabditis briggsae]CAP36367.1 Protein CBG19059 [Caenorhabditis briggsae]
MARPDTTLLWSLGMMIFPDLGFLTAKDREAIICNFFPRWIVMESSIDYCTNQEHHRKMMDNSEELEKMIVKFYGSSMERRKPDKEIVNIFKPYWVHFYNEIAESVFQMKLDKVECIALFLMILFDDAYTNISEEGAKLCRNLRKVVLRELKGYQTDNNLPEKRLLDVMSTLMLLEKGEEKMQEEIILCGLNNVNLHDDFKSIVQGLCSIFPEMCAFKEAGCHLHMSAQTPIITSMQALSNVKMHCHRNDKKYFLGTDEYYKKCAHFYGSSMASGKRIKDSETIRIFAPFWDWHYSEVAHPVYLKKLDKVEYMAIFLLLLFDYAYTNISEDGAKLCRNIRKVILRELKGYQDDKNCSDMRLADTIDTLRLLEKAEEKLQEENVLCGLHNLVLHDDWKEIFHIKKL